MLRRQLKMAVPVVIVCIICIAFFVGLNLGREMKKNSRTSRTALSSGNYGDMSGNTWYPVNAVLVGVNKCGTDTLLNFLSEHPEVNFVYQECMYCDSDSTLHIAEQKRHRNINTDRDRKVQLTRLSYQNNAMNAYQTNPNTKILLLVCDPIRRYTSAFTHKEVHVLGNGNFSSEAVSSMKSQLDKSLKCFETQSTTCFFPAYFKDYSMLAMKWLSLFGSDLLHVVDGDVFKKNPFKEMSKLEQFLGIRKFFTKSHFVFNKEKGFYCLNIDDVMCMGKGKGRTHPVLPDELLNRLRTFQRYYNAQFFRVINQTFDWD